METEVPFEYTVVRSRRRRTASLSIDMGRVEVRVPALTDARWVEQWLRTKVDWVLPRLQRQAQALDRYQIQIEQGASFWLRGEPYRLSWQRGVRSQVVCAEGRMEVLVSNRYRCDETEAVAAQLKQWMLAQASTELVEACQRLGQGAGLVPRAVDVRNYRRKWGQCTSRGLISLNWRLLHLPPEMARYVLIHELCHLVELNHGPAFWRLVAQHCPDYAQQRQALLQAYPFLIW